MASSGISVQFIARGLEPKPNDLLKGDRHDISPSHVFMIVKVPTNQGVKEEAYGFYPAKGVGVIKGPGMLRSEFRCGKDDDCSHSNEIKRFSEIEVSITIPISLEERRTILQTVNKWNNKEFQLNTQNCIDFVDAVVKDLGYPRPARSMVQLPIAYLNQLKPLVDQEQTKRVQASQELRRQKAIQEEKEQSRERAQRDSEPQYGEALSFVHSRGRFQDAGNGVWQEYWGNSPTFRFVETARDAFFIYAYDASRNTTLRMPIHAGLAGARVGNGAWKDTYQVNPVYRRADGTTRHAVVY